MPATVAIAFLLITVGSVAFHFWSPWWWTEVASNWGGMDDTIILTFWITGLTFWTGIAFPASAGPQGPMGPFGTGGDMTATRKLLNVLGLQMPKNWLQR